MKIDDNPFERFDLDPEADEETLTRQLRDKSRLMGPDERDEMQRTWRKLTSDPVERAQWLVRTHPGADGSDPWKLARDITSNTDSSELPQLQMPLEDALVLPRIDDRQLYPKPPFLPKMLTDGTPLNSPSRHDDFEREDDR